MKKAELRKQLDQANTDIELLHIHLTSVRADNQEMTELLLGLGFRRVTVPMTDVSGPPNKMVWMAPE